MAPHCLLCGNSASILPTFLPKGPAPASTPSRSQACQPSITPSASPRARRAPPLGSLSLAPGGVPTCPHELPVWDSLGGGCSHPSPLALRGPALRSALSGQLVPMAKGFLKAD